MTVNPDEILLSGHSLFVIAGARGVGKTNLAATLLKKANYDRLYVHDDEHSWNNINANLKGKLYQIGRYVSLADRFAGLPNDDDMLSQIADGRIPWIDPKTRTGLIEYYHFVLKDLDENLTPGKYDVYVLDTLKRFEAAMALWAEKNMGKLGVSNTSHGRNWSEGIFPLYDNFINSLFARGIKTVIFTSHLKQPWENNKPVPGKVVLSGKKILQFISRFMVWLIRDNRNLDGAPAGLVLKERLGQFDYDDEADDWIVRRVIPERIPHCTWRDIRGYLVNGYNTENPNPLENLSQEEKELISDALTDKQMQLMFLEVQKETEEVKLRLKQENAPILTPAPAVPQVDLDTPIAKRIAEILAEGVSETSLVKENLGDEFEGTTTPQIIKIIKALQASTPRAE